MRQRKIRGQKRRHQQIEAWRLENLDLRLDLIEEYKKDHVNIRVHPWCDISITDSVFPEPKGKTKQLMLNGLIDIYHSWKEQLDALGKPYYLKLWLFEQRFSKSQVVCAVGEKMEYYENIFYKPKGEKAFVSENFKHLKYRLDKFNWEHSLDEDYYNNGEFKSPELYPSEEYFEQEKRWFRKLLTKPHRTVVLDSPIGEVTELYFFKRGDLWVGELKG